MRKKHIPMIFTTLYYQKNKGVVSILTHMGDGKLVLFGGKDLKQILSSQEIYGS